MRVLFVDDEPMILQGLRRMLHQHRGDWDLHFAPDAREALRLVDADPFDVIVSDVRMPVVDGTTLLGHVRERHPEVVRVVLSGHVERDAAMRTAGVAHRFLSKPCDADALTRTLVEAGELSELLGDDRVRRLVTRLDRLPSVPQLLTELRARLVDPDTTVEQIAALIRTDVGMSTKLLQLVNSSFLGLAREITDVAQAVAYLGFGVIQTMVLSAELFRAFDAADRVHGLSLEQLSRHGTASARLAHRMIEDRARAQDAASAALLQDVGQLALAASLPNETATALELSRSRGLALHEVEYQMHGFTHADVGAYLLRLWGIPARIADAVAAHHRPLPPGPADLRDLTVVTRVAHLLVHRYAPGADDATDTAGADPTDELTAAGLDAHLPTLSAIALDRQLQETAA